MNTTYHAKCRMQQRAINSWTVEELTKYGQVIHKHGMKFMYMSKKNIKQFYPPNEQSEIQNVMILVAKDGTIITAYKNETAVKHVQKKNKRLSKLPKWKITNHNNTIKNAA